MENKTSPAPLRQVVGRLRSLTCTICGKPVSLRTSVPISWVNHHDDVDRWRGLAHRGCVEDHNEASGKPYYRIDAAIAAHDAKGEK